MKVNTSITRLYRQWLFRFWLRSLLIVFFSIVILFPWLNDTGLFISAIVISGLTYMLLRDRPDRNQAILLLNIQFPELEFSTKLAEEKALTGLAALQQKKVELRLNTAIQSFKYPVNWSILSICLVAAIMSFVIKQIPGSVKELTEIETNITARNELSAQEPIPIKVKLDAIQPNIRPPAYTELKAYTSEADISMPEGSEVTWSVQFSSIPEYAFLHFSNGDSLAFLQNQTLRSIRHSGIEQGFYWISYFDGEDQQRTPYYKIELVPDKPPVVEVSGIAQYQELPFSNDASLTFTASALDDYGLSDASIVATVTKGDGESVKFREERLSFKSTVSGKQFSEYMTLKASDFDMEPGNELYFYLEAFDEKTPEAQFNRTETFFFVLEDTADVEFSLVGSLGVDLMPEYFRSQRQIIIDTEKLLAEKADISLSEFKSRSNELGFDQKTLRLKYGQFLGEEAESGIAIENEVEGESDEDHEGHDHEDQDHKPGENVLEEFGHDHDHEDEAGQLMDKGTERRTEAEKAIGEIAHSHDDAETATFYEVSLKTKLRTALSEMWDAELYLRLFEPEKSLPYQYAALKLLKEIKNHARIYVQRIGFDPPPITEEGKRLTGDLDEIHGQNFTSNQIDSLPFPAIRSAVLQLSSFTKVTDSVPNNYQEVLRLAGNELAAEAIRYPSKYLTELGTISRLIKVDSFDREALGQLDKLNRVFLSLLEPNEIPPLPRRTSSHPLTERVREKLSNQSSRP